MSSLGIIVFLATYFLISARRLSWLAFDRPAGALLGAVLCVVFGVLSPGEAAAAVNGPTIVLLFGVMGMGAYLAVDGFFDDVESAVVGWARTPARLLGGIVWGAGILAAFITNDAVCVLGSPLLVRLIERHRLSPLPFLLALCTAANTGSAATLVGNPQNMLCGLLGGLSYRDHLLFAGPIALIGLCVNHALLFVVFRKSLASRALEPGPLRPALNRRTGLTLTVVFATAVAYTLGADLAWAAVTGFAALMLLHRRESRLLWERIDWSLLLFFAALFVVVEGLMKSGAPDWLFQRFPLVATGAAVTGPARLGELARLGSIFLIGSNVVSNVPFILVVRDQMSALPHPALGWELLAVASTFAGNLTLLGSVANIIVAENAREVGGIGFLDYLKVGVPLAVITTLIGVVWLYLFFPV